jgi:hypothetical protein
MSEHWLDALARQAAGSRAERGVPEGLTRRAVLKRAALGGIAMAGLGRLALPEAARADDLSDCLQVAKKHYQVERRFCNDTYREWRSRFLAPAFSRYRCLVRNVSERAGEIARCRERYPYPEPTHPPAKEPPKKPPKKKAPGKKKPPSPSAPPAGGCNPPACNPPDTVCWYGSCVDICTTCQPGKGCCKARGGCVAPEAAC